MKKPLKRTYNHGLVVWRTARVAKCG